jgi:hypothetical protein
MDLANNDHLYIYMIPAGGILKLPNLFLQEAEKSAFSLRKHHEPDILMWFEVQGLTKTTLKIVRKIMFI